jgi:hypothetical protein
VPVGTFTNNHPALSDLRGDALRADFLVLVRLNLWRDPPQGSTAAERSEGPDRLGAAAGRRSVRVGTRGYSHVTRSALRIPRVREILDEHVEDWDQVIPRVELTRPRVRTVEGGQPTTT